MNRESSKNFSNPTINSSSENLSREELLQENKKLRQDLEDSRSQINKIENLAHIESLTKKDFYLEKIISTFNMPFLVINENLKIVYANSIFRDLFNITEAKGQYIYDLKDKEWEIPDLRELLNTILKKKEYISNFQITHYFKELGQRILLVNGQMETDEKGNNLIMLCFQDITGEVEKQEIIEEKNNQLYFSIEAAQLGTYDYNPVTNKFTANSRLKDWFGISERDKIDLSNAINAIVEEDRERVVLEINKTLDPDQSNYYDTTYRIYNKLKGEVRTIRAQGRAWFNEEKIAYRLNGTVEDITHRVEIENDLKESLYNFNSLIHTSPYLFAILKGEEFIIEVANDAIIESWGKSRDIIGKPLAEELPEMEIQGIPNLLSQVYKTGVAYQASEVPIIHKNKNGEKTSYYNFVYQPQKNSKGEIIGVSIIANDVSEQAKLNNKVKESVQNFEEFVYSSPSLIAILRGPEFIIEIVNDVMLDNWGKDRSIVGKPLLEVLPEIKNQQFPKLISDVYHQGESYRAYEVPAIHVRNGKEELDYYNIIYQAQRNAEGDIYGVAIIATNVTDNAKLNQKIKEEEVKFREMADLIPDKITNAGADGSLLYCNKSWLDFTGMTIEDLKSGKGANLTHPDDTGKIAEARKKTFEKGIDLEIELRLKNQSGDYIWHLIRGRPLRDKSGKIISWLTATTEIQKLKEEQQKKEEFLKLVSHELKTPVTSIKGYTQLLKDIVNNSIEQKVGELPLKSSLNRIETQIERLTRLISEILDLSRMEDGKLELNRKSFSLNNLVKETIEDIKYSNALTNLHLHSKCDCTINADEDRIGQVLINFITNAIKYSPDNDEIHISVFHPNENEVAVSVSDNGIGISSSDQKNIFKRFYRVSGKNDDTYAGFGIGLYLSNDIIERHNGRIIVDSEFGKGSVFTFILPHHN